MLTCRASGNGFRRLVGTEAITASLRCCRFRTAFADIAAGFPGVVSCLIAPVAHPHCCGRRQCLGTGDVAPVSPAQVQKTSVFLAFRPSHLRARYSRTLPRSYCARNFISGLRRSFVSVLHQSVRPSFTSRRITEALLPRPSQSDSRVVAHIERVVGNGCHTASSTRTSHGVPALQGFTSSTLQARFYACSSDLRLTPDFAGAPFTCLIATLAVPACATTARSGSSSQGLDRWASRLIVLGSRELLQSSATPS